MPFSRVVEMSNVNESQVLHWESLAELAADLQYRALLVGQRFRAQPGSDSRTLKGRVCNLTNLILQISGSPY